jgi:hypothetical protein
MLVRGFCVERVRESRREGLGVLLYIRGAIVSPSTTVHQISLTYKTAKSHHKIAANRETT